tara:strand:+ start:6056 stop:6190 length:135 start_codon:yes stop_codon:yes gene_type:complete
MKNPIPKSERREFSKLPDYFLKWEGRKIRIKPTDPLYKLMRVSN